MQMALKDKPATPFRVPPGIKLIRVSAATGIRAGSGEGGGTILEAFKPGTAPPDTYTVIGGEATAGVASGSAARDRRRDRRAVLSGTARVSGLVREIAIVRSCFVKASDRASSKCAS